MFGLSPRQLRETNIWKLETLPLYSKPFRKGIAWTLGILVFFHTGVLATTAAFGNESIEGEGLGFAHWTIVPLVNFFISIVDAFSRYQRTLGPVRAVTTAAITFALWIVYIFLGFLPDYVYFIFACLAAPGLAASFIYLVLASLALTRRREKAKAARGGIELDPRTAMPAPSTHSGSGSGSDHRRADVGVDGKAINVEEQSWSPIR